MLSTDQMALLEKDMYEVARESYKEKPLQYPNILKVVPNATGGGDKSTQILGADKLRMHAAENESFAFRSPVQGWQTLVCYKTFSDAVAFTKNAVEDNVKTNQIGNTLKGYAETWGAAIRVSKEEFAANFFNYGGYTTGDTVFNGSWGAETDSSGSYIYDSKPFFNLVANARTTKSGNTYYNAILSGTLTPENFGTLYDLMAVTNKYTEMGTIMENKPDTLLTQDGSDYRLAIRILQSQQLPNGELNDKNPYEGICKAVNWSYLSGGAWYVGRAKAPEIEFHERQKPIIEFYRDQSTRGYRATVDVRFGVHLKAGAWKAWARNGGSYAASR